MKKFFRVAIEGNIADYRDIVLTRDLLTTLATSFNPELYGARINLEHIRGYHPDSTFKAYGDVTALKTQIDKIEINGENVEKMALYAEIDPTNDLVAMSKQRQKVYFSMEFDPQFKETGGAYFVGLAMTDSPAALGSSIIKFAIEEGDNSPLAHRKSKTSNRIVEANEVHLSFDAPKPSVLDSVKALFSKQSQQQETNNADVHQAIQLVAQKTTELETKTTALSALEQKFSQLETDFQKFKSELDGVNLHQQRPPATGGQNGSAVLTDC